MKYCLCCIAVCLFIWIGSAAGSPVGNIADPACLSSGLFTYERPNGIFAGLEADFVSDRKYENQSGDFTLNTYGVRFGAILRDNLMLYGFIGAGEYDDDKTMGDYNLRQLIKVYQVRIQTDPEPVYGLGVSAVMYEHKVNEGVFLRIGVDASYRKIELRDKNTVLYAMVYDITDTLHRGYSIIPNADYTLNINDYQGAVALSYQVDNFVPYVGALVMESRGHETISIPGRPSYGYDHDILLVSNKGLFVGLSYNYSNRFSLNMEARTRTETALSFRALVRF